MRMDRCGRQDVSVRTSKKLLSEARVGDFLIEGRVGGGDPLAPRHAEDSGRVTVRNPC